MGKTEKSGTLIHKKNITSTKDKKNKKIISKKINGKVFVSSQDASLPHNHQNKDFFMMKYGQYMFHCFKSRSEQMKWLKDTKAKPQYDFEMYEVLYGDRPCSFFADIEVYCPIKASYIEELANRILHDVNKECEANDEHDVLWLENHRKSKDGYMKISFHVKGGSRLYRGVVTHGPMATLATSINKVSENIFRDYPEIRSDLSEGPRKVSVLDMKVYTKNRPMRIIGSYKKRGEEGLKPCDISKGIPDEDFLIALDIPMSDYQDYTFVDNEIKETSCEKAIRTDHIRTVKVAPTSEHESLRKQIQDHLRSSQESENIHVSFEGLYGDDELLNFRVDGSNRKCSVCNKTHGSNGAYVKQLKNKDILYTCMSSFNSIRLPIRGRLVKKTQKETINPPDGRVPDLRDYDEKCISVIAGMNTGKTYRANEIIEKYDEIGILSGKPFRILVITCRKSMASGLQFRFKDFDLYTCDIESSRLIIEYESLHKTTQLYDIVIIDEVRSVLSTTTIAVTNRKNLLLNMERLKMNMKYATKVLLMDADSDIDGCVDFFIQDNFETVKEVRLEKPIMPREYILKQKQQVITDIIDDFKGGNNIVISFGSKKELDAVHKLLSDIEGNQSGDSSESSIRTYTADSPHKNELNDVDKYWGEYQVIMYTGCVTVALDFNCTIHRVYCFPNSTTMTPREMIQSTGRPRDVETNEIIVATDKRLPVQNALPPDYDMDYDYEQELSKIMERRNIFEMMDEIVNGDGKIEWVPNHIAKIWAYNRAERTLKFGNWIAHFRWILNKKKLKCIDESGKYCKEYYYEILKLNKETKEAEEIAILDEVDISGLGDDWYNSIIGLRNNGFLDEWDIYKIRKYEAQKYFVPELTGSDITFYESNKRRIWNQLSINKLSRREMEIFWNNDIKINKDFVRSDFKVLTLLEDILVSSGVNGYKDRENRVDIEKFDSTDVEEKLNQIEKISMCNNRSRTNFKKVMSYLKSLTGIKIDGEQKMKSGVRDTIYSIKESDDVRKVLEKENNMLPEKWISDKINR